MLKKISTPTSASQCSMLLLLHHEHQIHQKHYPGLFFSSPSINYSGSISVSTPASSSPLKCPVIHAICSIAHCVIQAKCSIAQCVIQAKCSSAHQPPVDGFNPPTVPVSCPSGQCSRPFLQLHSINLKWMCYTSILQCPAPVAGVPLIIFLFQHYFRTNPQFLNNPVNLLTCSTAQCQCSVSSSQ